MVKNGSFGFLRLACALEKPNVPFERWQKLFSRALAKNKKYISSIIFICSSGLPLTLTCMRSAGAIKPATIVSSREWITRKNEACNMLWSPGWRIQIVGHRNLLFYSFVQSITTKGTLNFIIPSVCDLLFNSFSINSNTISCLSSETISFQPSINASLIK